MAATFSLVVFSLLSLHVNTIYIFVRIPSSQRYSAFLHINANISFPVGIYGRETKVESTVIEEKIQLQSTEFIFHYNTASLHNW